MKKLGLTVPVIAAILSLIIIMTLDYFCKPSPGEILVEAHGLLFDIVLFGIIIKVYESFLQKKEKKEGYLNEIKDFETWKSEEARHRIAGNIMRLNDLGVNKVDMKECDLSGLVLENIDLEASKISKIELQNSTIRYGRFTSFESKVSIITKEAFLGYTTFEKSEIEFDCDFTRFIGCNFGGQKNIRGFFRLTDLTSEIFKQDQIEILKKNLKNIPYISFTDIESQKIVNNFQSSNLEQVDFIGCFLKDINFKEATIINVNFLPYELPNSQIEKIEDKAVALGFDITAIEIEKSLVEGRSQIRTTLKNASFQGANLSKVNFNNSDLSGVNFENATIQECMFENAVLDGAIFERKFEQLLTEQKVSINKIRFI